MIIFSCGTKQNLPLSNLTIGNEKADYLIENRKPDYGIDGGDGDVYMHEISMDISDLESNFIKGKVFDAKTNEPLANAYIDLILKNQNKENTLRIYSDSSGSFQKEFEGNLSGLEVQYVGYRNLQINFEKGKNTAHNNI